MAKVYSFVNGSTDTHLPGSVLDIVGRPPNGSAQGHAYVIEKTKAAAVARLAEIGIPVSQRGLMVAEGRGGYASDAIAMIKIGLLNEDKPGTVIAYREMRADAPVTVFRPGADDPEVVAHWRLTPESGRLRLVHVRRDVTLFPTTTVTLQVSPIVGVRKGAQQPDGGYGNAYQYAGDVTRFITTDDKLYVAGHGVVTAAKALELLSGLAGALRDAGHLQ